MFAFCRQFAERTDSSSSSTDFHRFSLSFACSSETCASCDGSAPSSKLMKIDSWSLRIFAANATASSGRTAPFVHTSRQPIVVGLLTNARVGDLEVHLADGR